MGRFLTYTQTFSFLYDFDVDGGSVGAISMREYIPPNSVVYLGFAKVNTTLTSAGATTISVGWTGDVGALVNSAAIGSFTSGSVVEGVDLTVAMVNTTNATRELLLTIEAADLTAGQFTYTALGTIIGSA